VSVDGPDITVSLVDPEYECVRIGGAAHPDRPADPPPSSEGDAQPAEDADLPALCPEGYVPRRRRRAPYELDGKHIRSTGEAERNPTPPPDDA
jgi:hypothetical protein